MVKRRTILQGLAASIAAVALPRSARADDEAARAGDDAPPGDGHVQGEVGPTATPAREVEELHALVTLALLGAARMQRAEPPHGYGVYAVMVNTSTPEPRLLGGACNRIFEFADTTRHAEIMLVQSTARARESALCDRGQSFRDCYRDTAAFRKVAVFTTLEPCLQCAAALLVARVGEVRFLQEDATASRLRDGRGQRVAAMPYLRQIAVRDNDLPMYPHELVYGAPEIGTTSDVAVARCARGWLAHVGNLRPAPLYRFDAADALVVEGRTPDRDLLDLVEAGSVSTALTPLARDLCDFMRGTPGTPA